MSVREKDKRDGQEKRFPRKRPCKDVGTWIFWRLRRKILSTATSLVERKPALEWKLFSCPPRLSFSLTDISYSLIQCRPNLIVYCQKLFFRNQCQPLFLVAEKKQAAAFIYLENIPRLLRDDDLSLLPDCNGTEKVLSFRRNRQARMCFRIIYQIIQRYIINLCQLQ